MRSGTTRMHRLLSRRPALHPSAQFRDDQPRCRARISNRTAAIRASPRRGGSCAWPRLANPRTLTIHPTGPYAAGGGTRPAGKFDVGHEARGAVARAQLWPLVRAAGCAPAPIEQMARLLRLVGWSQQSSSLRPWILKTPQHMLDLPALLEGVSRCAADLHPSRSAGGRRQRRLARLEPDDHLFRPRRSARASARNGCARPALQIERMRAARDAIPAERMIDVHYDDMERDWRGAMGRVYDFLGLDIGAALPRHGDLPAPHPPAEAPPPRLQPRRIRPDRGPRDARNWAITWKPTASRARRGRPRGDSGPGQAAPSLPFGSLRPKKRPRMVRSSRNWWARQGLNLRPHPCEGWECPYFAAVHRQKISNKNKHRRPRASAHVFHVFHVFFMDFGVLEVPDLSRIGERKRLKPKAGDEPYWQRLRQGCYLGYRPSKKAIGGTWFARVYDPAKDRNSRKRLGDYGTLSGHDAVQTSQD